MTESEKFLDKILTYVDDSDKHWFKCHKADIKAYAKIYHKEQLTLTDVGCSFSIGFAQYIAEEHYRLVNVENGKYYWKNETHLKTSQEILLDYKELID